MMDWGLSVALALALSAALLLALRLRQLRLQLQVMRYCHRRLSDYTASRVFGDSEEFDHGWRDVVVQQQLLIKRFGSQPMSEDEATMFERTLRDRGVPLLERISP